MSAFMREVQLVLADFETEETMLLRRIANVQRMMKEESPDVTDEHKRIMWKALSKLMPKLHELREAKRELISAIKKGGLKL